ncbi:MAG: delayed-early response protein/equilibrative nucleoside transporter [Ahrensia sp.]|mgnify:CR=1 FL=1|nr:delayed-early response protein/equilibrative nucleoside transporter [Ahrensia sp.]|tara:strand:+ start:2919 stop:3941 length:1023 start_codon:yes stop_codon:yes gene_type:complete
MKRHGAARIALVAAGLILVAAGAASAQSSLGIGSNEVSIEPTGGVFAHFFLWVSEMQRSFYREMTGALKAMRDDGSAVWLLVGLSFAYGIFHAAGPGHGKAVISSYMLANETLLRRGVILSFISAMLQAVSAIVLVSVAFLVLRGTAIKMTDATWFMETASYALIALFGFWLLVTKLMPRRQAVSLSSAAVHDHGHAHSRDHHHGHDHHHHGDGEVCSTCGHAHAPDPKMLAGPMNWRSAWAAVAAVGLRPCSGALIVLTFALLNGLVAGGVLSVFAMAVGTAITVSVLATIAVTAKNAALKFSGSGAMSTRLHRGIEIGGAALVMVLGIILLGGALAAY